MLAKQSFTRDEKDEIAIIQQTDVDAKSAKRSAAALGYLNDPFIAEFVKVPDRKSPIINRGTYNVSFTHPAWSQGVQSR
jgi:hypothetical protein